MRLVEVFRFEIRYSLRRASTRIYGLLLIALPFAMTHAIAGERYQQTLAYLLSSGRDPAQVDLVERHRLIAYDAAYLALALQLDAQLLTLDLRLAAAAGPRAIPIEDGHYLAEQGRTYEHDVTWPDYRGASAFLAKLRADAARTA
jgi:hypothetical protein